MGVLTGCTPRSEVLKSELDDAIFAADFGDLVAGAAPPVYGDSATFFRNTHPARELRRVVGAVFGRLANPSEGGATIRLSTGFGGGKTHTLMTLWHLAQNIGNPALGTELLPAAGRPRTVTVVGIDAGKAGVPQFATHGSTPVNSLWGELYFRLGGAQALGVLGEADDPEASPNEAQIQQVLPSGPLLILLDELVIYMAALSDRGQGNLLGFVNRLASIVGKRPQSVLVVTDPGGQAAYAQESARLQAQVTATARLDDVLGRRMSDFDPIGDESASVITRRLFESVSDGARQAASATYHALYKRVLEDDPTALPAPAASVEYAQRIVECYPFHPRLLQTAQDRLGPLPDFQRSRGVLRLFARIIRDTWEAGIDHELISAGEVDWSSPRIQADLLQRLNRDPFKAAVSADVAQHAGELDGGATHGVHRRAATALLLESLPMQPSSGLEPAELTLAVLRPEEAGPEPSEALDRLVGVCWHTYPLAGGRGWQFRVQPNVIKQIEERKGLVPLEDARSRVLAEAQGYFAGATFRLASWPATAAQVPDSAQLQLVLCEDESQARSICASQDDTDPAATVPRSFQNAIVGVAASPSALAAAIDRARRLKALEIIEAEVRTAGDGQLAREQLQRIRPEYQKQFKVQACRAFDRVVLADGTVFPLEEKYQVPEEQLLTSPQGQAGLKRCLDDKRLIYQPGDALDVGLFLANVLPGATPQADDLEVYTVKAVHERFLGAPNLRLVPSGDVVRRTIERAVGEGKLVVRLPDGRAFDGNGCVEGPEGGRRRVAGTLPVALPLDDAVLVTQVGSAVAATWLALAEDADGDGAEWKKGGGVPPPPPAPPGSTVATTWDQVVELAVERPLRRLQLVAATPAAASGLSGLAVGLGAESLTLSVTVSGQARDGGMLNYSADGVKHNHATKPLDTARVIHNALVDTTGYEATLRLEFGAAGRTGLADALGQLRERAPEGVTPRATFGEPAATAAS